MALILRSCVFCGNPMETKRASKQTCSQRCYMQMYRAKQKEQSTVDAFEENKAVVEKYITLLLKLKHKETP
ncbi:hypothetical protein D3C85_1588540 [compost metagenome]